MIARRIPTILPDLSFDEALEITKIHSIAGTLPSNIPLITTRPFRAPHHTVSAVSLTGGGKIPLEDGEVTISRVNASLTYPAKFVLIASMNPCPCGYYRF